jgi:hypothetical protein
MIIKPLITVNTDPAGREERLKALLAGRPTTSSSGDTNGTIARASDGYQFTNVFLAPGYVADVTLHGLIADAQKQVLQKQHPDWLAYAASGNEKVASSRLMFQLQRTCYLNRKNSSLQTVVEECVTGLRENYQQFFLYTSTGIAYQGAQGVVDHHDGVSTPQTIVIPEFTANGEWWTYLELAPEQPQAKLGNVLPIPANARPALELLLGPGYEQAGAIMQYASKPLANGNLPKVWFCTPTAKGRQQVPQRALVLGVGSSDRFNINADDSIDLNRPARGVAVRKKYST